MGVQILRCAGRMGFPTTAQRETIRGTRSHRRMFLSLLGIPLLVAQLTAVATPTEAAKVSVPSATTWHRVGPMSCPPRSYSGVAVFQDKLWILGGVDDNFHPIDDVWNSVDGVQWTKVVEQALWTQLGPQVAVFHDRLWLFGARGPRLESGGWAWEGIWSSADGITWSEVTSSPTWQGQGSDLKWGYGVTVFQDRLWVVGGDSTCLDREVWSSPDGVNWSCVTQQAPWPARNHFSLAVHDNRLWVAGGYGNCGQGFLNDVWYSTDGAKWTEAGAGAWHERGACTAAGFNDALWVFGGTYVEGGYMSTHDYYLKETQCSTDGQHWTAGALPLGAFVQPFGTLAGKLWCANYSEVGYMSPVTLSIARSHGAWYQAGTPLTLKAVSTGFPDNAAYAWLKDGTAIPGATGDTYHVGQTLASDSGSYTCQVTDENGVVFTAEAAPVTVTYEKVPAAGPYGLAFGVCAAAAVMAFRKRARRPRV